MPKRSVVFKYPVRFIGTPFHVSLPPNARVLSMGHQPAGHPGSVQGLVVWALHDDPLVSNGRESPVTLFVTGTGHGNDEPLIGWRFVSTVQTPDGLVWHLFVTGDVASDLCPSCGSGVYNYRNGGRYCFNCGGERDV